MEKKKKLRNGWSTFAIHRGSECTPLSLADIPFLESKDTDTCSDNKVSGGYSNTSQDNAPGEFGSQSVHIYVDQII